jgi:hypothetical protein
VTLSARKIWLEEGNRPALGVARLPGLFRERSRIFGGQLVLQRLRPRRAGVQRQNDAGNKGTYLHDTDGKFNESHA